MNLKSYYKNAKPIYWTGIGNHHMQVANGMRSWLVGEKPLFKSHQDRVHLYCTIAMHLGLVVENYAKAAWIEKIGPAWVPKGNGKKLNPKIIQHDLRGIFRDIGVQLDDEEEGLREILEHHVRGGYPATIDLIDSDLVLIVGERVEDGDWTYDYTMPNDKPFSGYLQFEEEKTLMELKQILNKIQDARQSPWLFAMGRRGEDNMLVLQQVPRKVIEKQ